MRTTIQYTEEFKQGAIQKAALRGDRSLQEVASSLGVPKNTLSTWFYGQGKSGVMSSSLKSNSASRPRSEKDWSIEEKFRVVLEAKKLEDQEQALGEFLRKEGLHSSTLNSWREELLFSAQEYKKVGRPKKDPLVLKLEQENHELKKELRRKEKALAETAALLVLKKKAQLMGLIDQDEEELP